MRSTNTLSRAAIAEANGKGEVSSTDTLTRAAIGDAIHRRIGLPKSEAAAIVETILRELCEALTRGENVKISGFGTFLLRDKGERVGRNPKTGVEVSITPRRVMTFRASQKLKEQISSRS